MYVFDSIAESRRYREFASDYTENFNLNDDSSLQEAVDVIQNPDVKDSLVRYLNQ